MQGTRLASVHLLPQPAEQMSLHMEPLRMPRGWGQGPVTPWPKVGVVVELSDPRSLCLRFEVGHRQKI